MLPVNAILPAEPTPTVATTTTTTQTPMTKSAATSIPVTVYNLAQGKFQGIPNLTTRVQGEGPSTPRYNNPQEQQPEATAAVTPLQNREDTPWPNTMPASTNLFGSRASWPILPTEPPTVVMMEKAEVPPRIAAIPHALVLNKPQNNKPVEEECRWEPHCPIFTKEEGTRDWYSERQENQQRNHCPQSPQHPKAYDIPDRFSQQIKLEKEWNEKMEHLNSKYNLDYYSNSESDSDFEQEHKYETLI